MHGRTQRAYIFMFFTSAKRSEREASDRPRAKRAQTRPNGRAINTSWTLASLCFASVSFSFFLSLLLLCVFLVRRLVCAPLGLSASLSCSRRSRTRRKISCSVEAECRESHRNTNDDENNERAQLGPNAEMRNGGKNCVLCVLGSDQSIKFTA